MKKQEMNISIVMATYQGESFLEQQIQSLLCQMNKDDELIISDDGSSDLTTQIAQRYCAKYENIRFVQGPRQGIVKNFQNAIRHTKGELIMFSDQDDIWHRNKLDAVRKVFFKYPDCWLVTHDASYCDEQGKTIGNTIFADRKTAHGVFKNFIRSSFYGCCMTVSAEFMEQLMPFPDTLVAHDQWIGLIAEKHKRSILIDDVLIRHRIHESNESRKLSVVQKIVFRMRLIKNCVEFEKRYKDSHRKAGRR